MRKNQFVWCIRDSFQDNDVVLEFFVDICPWTHAIFILQNQKIEKIKKLKMKFCEVAPFRVDECYEPFIPHIVVTHVNNLQTKPLTQ